MFETSASLIGCTIGQYEVLEEIGRGGMGVVYKARHQILNRDYVLKILPAHLAQEPQFVARFHAEARAASSVPHPNIVRVIDTGQQDGLHYIVMEYVAGHSLASHIEAKGNLSLAETSSIARQIGSALDFAHQQGIVHRDVKPGNILLDKQGHALLTDFGIAKSLSGASLTLTGVTLGTPGYLSPEQAEGHEVDWRTDLFSFAVVLYEALTGANPFQADTPVASAYKTVHTPARPIRSLRKDLPAHVGPALSKGLAKNPADRFAMATALVAALEGNVAGTVFTPVWRRWTTLGAFGLCALLIAGIMLFLAGHGTSARQPDEATPLLLNAVALIPTATSIPIGVTAGPNPTATPERATATVVNLPTRTNAENVALLLIQVDNSWSHDWPEVIELLVHAHQIDDKNQTVVEKLYSAYYNYGKELMGQGRKSDASEQFRKALDLRPDGAEVRQVMLELTPTSTPTTTPTATPRPNVNCIQYEPTRLRIADEGAPGWRLTDDKVSVALLDDQADGQQALELAKRYARTCVVGLRQNGYYSQYWDSPSELTSNLVDRDCILYDPGTVRIYGVGQIREGDNHSMLLFDSNSDAQFMLRIVQQYTRSCYIGRDNKRANRRDYIYEYWK